MLLERRWKKPLYPTLEHVHVEAPTHIGLKLMQMNKAPSPVVEYANEVDEECLQIDLHINERFSIKLSLSGWREVAKHTNHCVPNNVESAARTVKHVLLDALVWNVIAAQQAVNLELLKLRRNFVQPTR